MIGAEINGLRLDLYEGSKVAINKAIGKIGDVSNRNGDFSIIFKAPLNPHNLVVLGNITTLSNHDNPVAFKRFNGRLTKGTLTISSGYFQVIASHIGKAEIEIRFLGGNSDWFERVSSANIAELDYSDIVHVWNVAGLILTWQPVRLPYVYIPFDNLKDNSFNNNNPRKDSFLLCVSSLYILQKIFAVSGLKVAGSILNDARVRNEMIASGAPLVIQELSEGTVNRTPTNQDINDAVSGDGPNFANWDLGDINPNFNGTIFTALSDHATLNFDFNVVVKFINTGGTPPSLMTIFLDYTGGADQEIAINLTQIGADAGTIWFVGSGSQEFTAVSEGDTVTISHFTNAVGMGGTQTQLIGGYGLNNSTLQITYEGDTTVDPGLFLPETNQGDFIKDIMFRNGYVSTFDAKSSTVTFNKFDELEGNKRRAPDWSQYIDHNNPPTFDFTEVLEGYSKRNIIGYKEDSDDIQLAIWRLSQRQGLGSAIIESDSDYVTGESTLYESPFAPTAQIWTWPYDVTNPSLANWLLPYVPLFSADGDVQSVESRILLFAGVVPVTSYNRGGETELRIRENEGGQTTTVTETGYGFFR